MTLSEAPKKAKKKKKSKKQVSLSRFRQMRQMLLREKSPVVDPSIGSSVPLLRSEDYSIFCWVPVDGLAPRRLHGFGALVMIVGPACITRSKHVPW